MRTLAALLTLSTVLAGCLGPSLRSNSATPGDVAGETFANVKTLLAGLPCKASSVSDDKTSDNLRLVSATPFDGSMHGEIDVSGAWLLDARYQTGGFEVVSIADPTRPVTVSFFQSEDKSAYDVKWMPDGRSAIVGHGGSIDLVDVSPILDSALPAADLAKADVKPVLVSSWKYPSPGLESNMHMLYAKRIAGADYVFVAPNDNTGVWILKLAGEGAAHKLEVVTQVGAPLGGGPLGPHDMTVLDDVTMKKPILYVANGFEGWQAFDVSDPKAPKMLATVPNLDPAQSYTHTIMAEKIGGRRIVVTIAEVGVNMMKVYDASDFTAPILLGEWKSSDTTGQNPEHNIQLLNGTLYLAHYTHGLYAFDLTKLGSMPLADTATLAPVAHFAPPKPQAEDALGFANVWDVVVHDGLLYVNDINAGVYAVGYGCIPAGDPLFSSVG